MLFRSPGRIHDPIQAVLLLGVKTVEAMVLTEGIFARLDPELVRMFGVSAMQAHCFRVSRLARKIGADLEFSNEQIETASTAGILHDAGKIILHSEMKDVFTQALARSRAEGRALYEVEQELLGISHAELVGAMLQLWAMPAEIIEATACHHRPSEAASVLRSEPVATLADVICLADAIDHCFSSSGADGASPEIDPDWLSRLGLVEACRHWTQRHIEIQNKELCNGCKPQ